MISKLVFSLFIILISTVSIIPPVFAQEANTVHIPEGVNEPGCEKTQDCFVPFEITISTGEKVTWINNDVTPHTITAGNLMKDVNKIGTQYANGFNSPLLESGDSWSHTFNTPGTYPYFSMVGVWMAGIVIVEGEQIMEEKVIEEEVMEEKVIEEEVMEEKVIEEEVMETSTFQDAYILIDEPPTTEIYEGDIILITGGLITADGAPISGKNIHVETTDSNGETFFDDVITDEDGEFLAEGFFFSSGEAFVSASFEGDSKYSEADSTTIIEITILSDETEEELTTEETTESSSFELPSIELPSLPSGMPGLGGCLIATATYGSELAPQVQSLREIRDNTLLQSNSGTAFMSGFNTFYYSFSPIIADWERQNPVFKEAVKITITPLVTSLSILNYIDIDSEAEVLGYGIGVILLNIGMYFVAPAILILQIKKKIIKKIK